MVAFHTLFPEEAKNECRSVTPFNDPALPSRTFLVPVYRPRVT
jgi:hypothetical protein